jgi:hypothetical protein
MTVDALWYVPNTVIWRDLQTLTAKEEMLSIHWSEERTPKQAIAKTPTKWSAYQIPSAIVVFVILVFKV